MADVNGQIKANYYITLALTSHSRIPVSLADIKLAYRKALLSHHPDKLRSTKLAAGQASLSNQTAPYSIDEITTAFKILSDPVTRREHDQSLSSQVGANTFLHSSQDEDIDITTFRSGLEVVDLDDLQYDDNKSIWYKSCRCGDTQGFIVSESELDSEAESGEIITGCRGCSLWVKVHFEVLDDTER
jgi:diphthamide biosynthesis protein 4